MKGSTVASNVPWKASSLPGKRVSSSSYCPTLLAMDDEAEHVDKAHTPKVTGWGGIRWRIFLSKQYVGMKSQVCVNKPYIYF